jgi:hypothetical protein
MFVAGEAWSLFGMFRTAAEMRGGQTYLVDGAISRLVQGGVVAAGMLTGIGAQIELVDQIRWTIVRAAEKK